MAVIQPQASSHKCTSRNRLFCRNASGVALGYEKHVEFQISKAGVLWSKRSRPCQLLSWSTLENRLNDSGACFHPEDVLWVYSACDVFMFAMQVALMIEARYLHSSAALDDHLYVIGGHNGRRRLSSVEKYNPDSNSWSTMKPMLKELSSTCSVATDGYLYVIGKNNYPIAGWFVVCSQTNSLCCIWYSVRRFMINSKPMQQQRYFYEQFTPEDVFFYFYLWLQTKITIRVTILPAISWLIACLAVFHK